MSGRHSFDPRVRADNVTTPAPDLPDYTGAQQPVTVPTVIASTSLGPGGHLIAEDVSAYTSAIVQQSGGTPVVLVIAQSTPTIAGSTAVAAALVTSAATCEFDITGGLLAVTNTDVAETVTVTVIGYGRVTPTGRATVAGWSAEVLNLALPSTVMVANTSYPFPAPTNGQLFQGPAYANFQLSGTTATGLWRVRTAAGGVMILADTSETHTSPNGNRAVYKPCAFPANVNEFDFLCNVAGTASGTIQAVPNY